MIYQFWIILIFLFLTIAIFDKKYFMLRDTSKAPGHQPYSWARVQLAWWTVIVLSSFIAILWHMDVAPTLNSSTVILLGISAATTATARVIDISDETNLLTRHQDDFGKNFFLDILSDQTGVSVSRFQTVAFNLVFGIWFISTVLKCLNNGNADNIMPTITDNNLILLGLSTATYAAMKTTENKTPSGAETKDEQPETVADEANNTTIAQG